VTYVVEIVSDNMIYMPIFVGIGSSIQKLWDCIHIDSKAIS
jgi:hypothetical protein